MWHVLLRLALALAAAAPVAAAEIPLPAAPLDPSVPALEEVVGVGWGERITTPEEAVRYAEALAAASPRVRLERYATSLEGRPLVLLIVASRERLARLEDVRAALARLGDPRLGPAPDPATLPAVVWLACSVHGDEPSATDAGLELAYLLAAGGSPEVNEILERAVVVVDVCQNPDGRARFVASTRAARGIEPDATPWSAEHDQPWPGGRYSHDLFDLNRDWFVLTHPETRGRVRAMLSWLPTLVADLHEMGASMGYYFPPPAHPYHPAFTSDQVRLWERLGHALAAAFDARGWRYWTREIFDSFYPGYGESWPLLTGALGMTFEEASSRGLRIAPRHEAPLAYRDTVLRHLTAAWVTVLEAARHATAYLGGWAGFRRRAVESGRGGWTLSGEAASGEAAELAELLAAQGIEVYRGAGGYAVPAAQPLGALARTLLELRTPVEGAFAAEQERRVAKGLEPEYYDITAWSLPALWNVPVAPLARGFRPDPDARVNPGERPAGGVVGRGSRFFVADWNGLAAARLLARLLREGVVVRSSRKPLRIAGRSFHRGSLVVRADENGDGLRRRLEAAARVTGAQVVALDSSFAEEGVDLGSTAVRRIEPPRVALLWGHPARPTSAGHLRHAIERMAGYPVTVVRPRSLARVPLEDVDVLVIPDGSGWSRAVPETQVQRLVHWVEEGGTLVAVGAAAEWLATDDVGLLPLETRPLREKDEPPGGGAAPDAKTAGPPRRQPPPPPRVPGAILAARADEDNVLAAGLEGATVHVLVTSRRAFEPPPVGTGFTVVRYRERDPVVSGVALARSRELLPGAAYMVEVPRGRGHVVAFAEDPAFRGMPHASIRLLLNAVLLARLL